MRWTEVRGDLRERGADDQTLAALDVAIEADADTPGRHGLVAVAAGGTLRLSDTLPNAPARSTGRWSALPHLLPYLAQRATRLAHVVVVADRTGADILVVDAEPERAEQVAGSAT